MPSLIVRNIDVETKERLRMQAARHGRSMEAEVRDILAKQLAPPKPPGESLYEAMRRRIEPFGGVELDIPPRGPDREPPDFS